MLLSGAVAAAPDNALQLNGTSQYVRFGTVGATSDALNASQFTLEVWFNRTGTGTTTSTGTGGVTAAPLLAKGRAEAENSTADMNYFLGIDAAGKLVADYEEGAGTTSPGLNHPVTGATTITNNVWHHAAATLSFDAAGAKWVWKLYLDGKLDASLDIAGASRGPRSDSVHRTALGSALTTTGVAAGFFQGLVDEARIWNVARSGSQIRASRNNEILSATTNLAGRWGLDEGAGATAADTSSSGIAGTLVGTPAWVTGYTFPQDTTAPAAVAGLTATPGNTTAALSWSASGAGDLAGYNVFRSTTTPVPTNGTPLNGADLLQATSFNDTGLTNGTTYHYAVVAVDTSDNNSPSAEVSATPQAPTAGQAAVQFASAQNEYVTFGAAAGASELGAQNLTIETWFRRTGAGVGTSTGTGGLPSTVPLVTKGRAQAETPANLNMNYFLGLDSATSVLVADFEDTATGGNHPVSGVTSIAPDGTWHHAAATYDGDEWRLYLDGRLERKLFVGTFTPESTSIQHAAVATAQDSTGAAAGFFQGEIDETRVWNVARSGAQIRSAKDDEIASDAAGGLIGRWGFNDGAPSASAADTSGRGNNGTLVNTPTWVSGYTFTQDVTAPTAPSGLDAVAGNGSASLTWTASGSADVSGYEVYRSTTSPVTTSSTLLTTTDLVTGTSYTDDDAVNGQQYFYAVRAIDTANNPSSFSNEDSATPTAGDPVFVGAGDIADCALSADTATASLVASIPGQVFTIGDNVYPNGTDAEFANCYEPTWGAFKARTRPAPGNHDYNTPGATGYYNYFNGVGVENGPAGDRDLGYYSYEIDENGARWHVVVLNSECEPTGGLWLAGGCAAGSTQEQWLRSDLASAPTNNIIAIWHKPRFASGGNHAHMQALWQALYDHGVDLALGGHWHNYERFAPLNANGAVDNAFGVRSFVVGTGGASLSGFGTAPTGSELRNNTTHGVMKFTLHASSYDWAFIPIAGQTFTDSGTQAVHAPPPAPTGGAFRFNGSNQYVTFGQATSALGASTLTLETWFRRTGAGVGTNTGTGGFGNAIPLITKGRGEAEGSNVDMNYFLGIDVASNVLVADFEDAATGTNHPASGTTAIASDGAWHHAAATYDGDEWRLYLDGRLETRTTVGAFTPRSDSIQHAALASALNSTGAAAGFFAGDLDEARIWSVARTGSQIRSAKDDEITGAATGLRGRWALNDTTGTNVADTSGNGTNGTAVGNPARVAGHAFPQDTTAPTAPTGLTATAGNGSVGLTWTPSSGSDIAGYDVFRATSPGVDTNGVPLNGGDLVSSASFVDTNATNGVTYWYAVRAVDTADNRSGLSAEASATPEPGDPVFVGAGDIADCNRTQDTATANLVAGIPGHVFTLGDNVYPDGTDAEFANCYAPTWGAFKDRTRPAPGNHDYNTPGATGYYNYFNGVGVENGPAGDRDLGYYSYDIDENGVQWHVVVLNSDCEESTSALWLQNGCVAGSAQEQWLRDDLATAPTNNIIAIWHKPRFSSGGSFAHMQAIWQALYDHGVDLALAGHWHNYERMAPANGAGQADNTFGVRSFVIGTGGAATTGFGATHPLSQVRNGGTFGVMKFTLHASSYDWQFIPIAGQTFTDTGTQSVHGPPDQTPPVVDVVSAVPANLGAADSSTVVTWNATENGGFSVRVGGTSCSTGNVVDSGTYTTAPANRQSTVSASTLAEGANTIRVCVTDSVGNTGDDTIAVSKDTTAPIVDAVSADPAALGADDASTTITWNASENGAFSVRVGGNSCTTGTQVAAGNYTTAPANTTTSVAATSLTEGANTIRVCVLDAASNTGADFVTVDKDTTTPTVDVVSAEPAALGDGDLGTTVTWNANENGTFSVRVGGTSCTTGTEVESGTYATSPSDRTSNVAASALAQGANTIRVCVTDAAGNTGSDTIVVDKDTVAPVVDVVSAVPPTLGPADASTVVTWNASENGSYSVRVGGTNCATGTEVESGNYSSSPGNTTTTVPASALAEGANTIRVCVTDSAGNTGGDTVSVSKDTAAPATPSITGSSPTSPAEDNNPELIGTAETGSTVRLYTASDCSEPVAAMGAAAAFASPGLSVEVEEDSTTTFYARATDAAGNVSACSTGFTYVEATGAPPAGDPLLLSFLTDGTVGSLAFADEDIVAFDGTSFSLAFDGSDVGLSALNLDAFGFLDADSILMSFATAGAIGSLGTADDSDVVRFDASSLGATTAGTFSMYFDGSDVSLTSDGEDVDAVQQLADGRLVLSTVDTPSISGVSSPRDEDLLAFTPTSLGDTTAGTFAMHFEGSDVGLSTDSGEDVDAAWTSPTGQIYLSTLGAFSATGGPTGADEDVFVCTPTSLGATTACNFSPSLLFDGSAHGLAANNVDGVGRARGPVLDGEPPTAPTNLVATAVGATRVDLSWGASEDNVGVTEYRIFRNGVQVGTTQTTSFSDTGLQSNTTYSYLVRAYDLARNQSDPSNSDDATTGPPDEVLTFNVDADTFLEQGSPTVNNGAATAVAVDGSPVRHILMRFVVSGIGGRQITSARIRLHCVDSSPAGGTFFRAADGAWSENTVAWNGSPQIVGNALSSLGSVSSGTWYETSVAGAVGGEGTYSFRVTSTNSNGADYAAKERGGNLAAQLIVTVAGTPPEPDTDPPTTPENLQATAVSAGRVDLSWNASTDDVGVRGYKIYRDGLQIASTSGTGTTFSDTTVSPNTSYTYNVAAFDTQNTSLQSLPASVTTPPAPPAPTTLTFAPTDDAYVRVDDASVNFGSATTLQVDGSPQKKFLLKFTVAGVGSREVLSAKLRLHAVDSSPNGGEAHAGNGSDWSESTITWNTPFTHNPAVLGSFGPVSSGNWYELELKTHFNGDGTKTVVVTSPASDGADYVSKEGTAALRPQLVLTVQ